eukprot:364985-Chlamydomonas_euryale.AAC.3
MAGTTRQGSYNQHNTWRGFAKAFEGVGRGCARLRQVTWEFRQFRHLVTPYARYATPRGELRPHTWRCVCAVWKVGDSGVRGVTARRSCWVVPALHSPIATLRTHPARPQANTRAPP